MDFFAWPVVNYPSKQHTLECIKVLRVSSWHPLVLPSIAAHDQAVRPCALSWTAVGICMRLRDQVEILHSCRHACILGRLPYSQEHQTAAHEQAQRPVSEDHWLSSEQLCACMHDACKATPHTRASDCCP